MYSTVANGRVRKGRIGQDRVRQGLVGQARVGGDVKFKIQSKLVGRTTKGGVLSQNKLRSGIWTDVFEEKNICERSELENFLVFTHAKIDFSLENIYISRMEL